MPAGDTYKVRTRGTLRAQKVEFGVHLTQTGVTGSVQDIASSWVATIVPLALAAMSTEVNLDDVVVSDVKTVAQGGVESFVLGITQPSPGTITGDALPGQNAAVISLRTGIKGGRRRGRFYVPGLSEANVAGGLISGGQLTAIQALAAGIINAYGPGGTNANYRLNVWSPEVLTFKPPRTPKPRPGVQLTPVTSFVVDNRVRTQRRRQLGVGR
jgi:hypothetical protein